jgi:hypothetical protein
VNSYDSDAGPPADRPKKDGRLRVLLRRRMGDGDETISEATGDGTSISIRERCTRLKRARRPPGTEGALVICTGRGFAADGDADGGGLLSRGRG